MKNKKIDISSVRFYSHNGAYYPSVTSIGKLLAKGEGFERWLANQPSYKAACEYRDFRAREGSLVHEMVSKELTTGKEVKHAKLAGFLRSFRTFRKLYEPTTTYSEEVLFNKKLGFAGTLDWYGWVKVLGKKTPCLIDFKTKRTKTTDADTETNRLQVGAYSGTLLSAIMARLKPKQRREIRKTFRAFIVTLREDGSFVPTRDIASMDYAECMKAYKAFGSMVKIFDWANAERSVGIEELEAHCLPITNPRIVLK